MIPMANNISTMSLLGANDFYYNHPVIILNAVLKTAENGLSFGAPTPLEIDLAELVCSLIPSIEMVEWLARARKLQCLPFVWHVAILNAIKSSNLKVVITVMQTVCLLKPAPAH